MERCAREREPKRSKDTIGDILDLYESSGEFKRRSESTNKEWSRIIRSMKDDVDCDTERSFCSLPTSALSARQAPAMFTRWRDQVGEARGPRAADYRMQVLKRALGWAMKQGHVRINPAMGVEKISRPDRSDLIWEPEHIDAYLTHVRREIDIAWSKYAPDDHRRWDRITKLSAGRDALIVGLHTGMRLDDIANHTFPQRDGIYFRYQPLKGKRRAKTSGKKPSTKIVPLMPAIVQIYARRQEASGGRQPHVITSARGRKYTQQALGSLVAELSGGAGVDRTLHDTKGTFITRALNDGWLISEVAMMVDWSETDIQKIAAMYVSQEARVRNMLQRKRNE